MVTTGQLISGVENFLQRAQDEFVDVAKKEESLAIGRDLFSRLSADKISDEEAASSLAKLYDVLDEQHNLEKQ